MAGKKKEQQVEAPSVRAEASGTCGDCASAVDFRVAGADGRPVLCRCSLSGSPFYLLCHRHGCRPFTRREEGAEVGFSPSMPIVDIPGKVVPVFERHSGSVLEYVAPEVMIFTHGKSSPPSQPVPVEDVSVDLIFQ